jgi:hypothetical protein
MVAKRYRKRTNEAMSTIRGDKVLGTPLFDNKSSSELVGLAFKAIAVDIPRLRKLASVNKAFQEAGLDPRNPFCWLELLNSFCTIHYTTGARGQRVKVRDQMQRQVDELVVKHGEHRKTKLSELFLTEFGAEYPSLKKSSGVRRAFTKYNISVPRRLLKKDGRPPKKRS